MVTVNYFPVLLHHPSVAIYYSDYRARGGGVVIGIPAEVECGNECLYEVTVAVGRPARGYPGDPHNLSVEGTKVVDDEITTDQDPVIVRTVTIDLTDGSLSLEVGGRSQTTGDFAYTFLGYMDIVPVN